MQSEPETDPLSSDYAMLCLSRREKNHHPHSPEKRPVSILSIHFKTRTADALRVSEEYRHSYQKVAARSYIKKKKKTYSPQLFSTNSCLFTVFCLLFSAYCFLLTVFCSLFSAHCFLLTVFCLFTIFCSVTILPIHHPSHSLPFSFTIFLIYCILSLLTIFLTFPMFTFNIMLAS